MNALMQAEATVAMPVAAVPEPEPPRDWAIRAVGLSKSYETKSGEIEAVRGIDLEVRRGEFFGLLGPNGAGKSTTIGMLTTLVRPTEGYAEVAGFDAERQPVSVKRRIGMVSQNNSLDRQLNVIENIEYRGRYFGMTAKAAKLRAQELLELFDLDRRPTARVYELSGGQAKRVMICRALVHQPDVLFLDEPTAGIDPQTRANLQDVLRELHRTGQTILLTTHYMEEAEQLCDRVAIIDRGRILADGSVKDLVALAATETVLTVNYDGPAASIRGVSAVPGVSKVEISGNQLRVFASNADGLLGALVDAGTAAGRHLQDVAVQRPSLERAFLTLTGREYRE